MNYKNAKKENIYKFWIRVELEKYSNLELPLGFFSILINNWPILDQNDVFDI